MPRKPIDIKPTDHPSMWERALLHPFPAFRRGQVRAGLANGSRDWSLVGAGAMPQGLKSSISVIFKVQLSLFFRPGFFIDYLTLPYTLNFKGCFILRFFYILRYSLR